MTKLSKKAVAYITQSDLLLVFSHPAFPAAGIQVPAGTIEENESPQDAVLREAFEETGLRDLQSVAFLGERHFDMAVLGRDEIQHRFFFHLYCPRPTPARWRHEETNGGNSAEPIVFEFFWVVMPGQVPDLIADQGALLPVLFETLLPK